MMTTTEIATPDLEAVKRRQQQAWVSGDYAAVASRIVLIAERLVDAADLRAGTTVLDVATGSGNSALAAARCGCEVIGVDYVPELLERGRVRAAAEGLPVEFMEGDAENLSFPDGSFDAVLSCLGVMFTPNQERAAAELLRVCRPGGDDRPGQLDAERLRRRDVPHRGQACSAATRRQTAGLVGDRRTAG